MGNQSTSAHNGSPNPLLLHLLQAALGRLRKGSLPPNRGMEQPHPALCAESLSAPWAGLVCHAGVLHAASSALVPRRKMGMKVFHRMGGRMPRAPSPTRAVGGCPQLKLPVVPHYSQLIRTTPILPCEPSANQLLPKQHFFLLLLMSFVTSAIFFELCYKLIIYSELRFFSFPNSVHFCAS